MTSAEPTSSDLPAPRPRLVICPFCGQKTEEATACSFCKARFDPLSRQATQNAMGPWYIHDERKPHAPGCRFQALVSLIEAGKVTGDSVLRGPSTRQFWMLARHTPGVANLLGACHNCGAEAEADDYACDSCGAVFVVDQDRQHLGLGPVRELNAEAPPADVPDRPEVPVSRGAPAVRTTPTHPPRTASRTLPTPPKVRRISPARLTVNWLVGTALFVLILAITLSTLQVLPENIFSRGAEESPEIAMNEGPDTSSGLMTEPVADGRRELRSFSEDAAGLGLDEGNAESGPVETQVAQEDEATPETPPAQGLSRTEQVQRTATDALRMGDPKAIRDSIVLLEALLAQPRAPEWAADLRDQLVTRLERARFARLP